MMRFKALLFLFLLSFLLSQTAFGQTYSISGDIDGIDGSLGYGYATMRLRMAGYHTIITTVVSNSSGNYTFTGLPNGDYTIQPAIYGYEYTPGVRAVTISGADVTGVDFLVQLNPPENSIYGTVSGPGSVGATITLGTDPPETTLTDSTGYFIFPDVPNGTYTVVPNLSGYAYTPDSFSATVNDYDRLVPNFVSFDSQSFSGTISGDIQEGVIVNLYIVSCGSPQPYDTVTTDSEGYYSFGSIENGRYIVAADYPGYSFSSGYWIDIPQAEIQSYDFTATSAP